MKFVQPEPPQGKWQTTDGSIFTEKRAAIAHERKSIVTAAFAAHGMVAGPRRISAVVEILDTLIEECHNQGVLPEGYGTREDF